MENHFALQDLQHQLQGFLYEDQLGAGAHTRNLKKKALLRMIFESLVEYVINRRKMKTT